MPKGTNTFLTNLGNGSFTKDPATGYGGRASVGGGKDTLERARDAIGVLFGPEGTKLSANRSIDLDNVYGSAPHSSLGLQVAIAGRSTIVQADVAAHLMERQDPIRSVLGLHVTDSHRVIIKRRFVMARCRPGYLHARAVVLTPNPTPIPIGRRRRDHSRACPRPHSLRQGGGTRGRARPLRRRVREWPIHSIQLQTNVSPPIPLHSLEMNTNLLLEPALAKADL